MRPILASTVLTKTSRKLRLIHSAGSTSVAQRRKFQFTKKAIEALPSPENGQRAYYYDREIRGLAVAVSPAGKKVFILYRKIAGRPERLPIGPCCDLSIDQARGMAEEMNGAIARGENPAATKRAIRDETTLGELFAKYLEEYAKVRKRLRTWQGDVSQWNTHFKRWSLRKLSSIRKADVIAWHAHIGSTSGIYAANHAHALLSSMYNTARRDWDYKGENPAAGVRPFKEQKRERFLDAGELPAFFDSLRQEENSTIRDYVWISLLTGARRDNVQTMRWEEINAVRSLWTIPAEKAKGGKPLNLYLSPEAFGILNQRKIEQQQTKESDWVFPGVGKSGHLVEPKTAWKRILKRAGLTDVRLHDLRRTLGSWQAATGASLPVIGKTLGHLDQTTTAIYARLNLDPVRDAVNLATRAMLSAGDARLLKEGQ
jgi:integrase